MRTNIHLNDELLQRALRLSGAKSKTAVIEQALRVYIDSKAAAARRESYRRRVARIEEKTRHLRRGESAVEILRADRERT